LSWRLACDARDALRVELEATASAHEAHARDATNRLKEQLRSAQVRGVVVVVASP
jgi:predicted deacylase